MKKSYKLAIALISLVTIIGTVAFVVTNMPTINYIVAKKRIPSAEEREILNFWMNYRPSPNINDEEFAEIKDDLDVLMDFLKGYADKNKNRESIVLIIGYVTSDTMYMSPTHRDGRLKLDENIHKSLLAISEMFINNSYSCEFIAIENNFIVFHTIDGQYSLVYSIDGKKPDNKCHISGDKLNVIHIEGNYYHRVITW